LPFERGAKHRRRVFVKKKGRLLSGGKEHPEEKMEVNIGAAGSGREKSGG